jgi:hypothetical protein
MWQMKSYRGFRNSKRNHLLKLVKLMAHAKDLDLILKTVVDLKEAFLSLVRVGEDMGCG